MIEIPLAKRLEPYFEIAEVVSARSPCIRRQYGSVIIEYGPHINHWSACNERLSACCNGMCARNIYKTLHGQRVEVGAEIHSEVAALINAGKRHDSAPYRYFVLVGFEGEHELKGKDVYPCHACILAIKFARFDYIYIKDYNDQIVPVSVSEILQFREREWEYDD